MSKPRKGDLVTTPKQGLRCAVVRANHGGKTWIHWPDTGKDQFIKTESLEVHVPLGMRAA